MAITYIQNRTKKQLLVKGTNGENYFIPPKARETFIPCGIDDSCKRMIGKEILIIDKKR